MRGAPQGVILVVLSQSFKILRGKKHNNIPCFWRLTGQKSRYCCCYRCWCIVGGGCYPCSFFLFRSGRKSSNRRCVRVCFQILGANNTVNTDIFLPRKPKPTIFMMFLFLVAKHRAKTLAFVQFSTCCKK